MKRKFLLALLGLVCALCCALGLAACGGGDGDGTSGVYIVRASDGTELGSTANLGECTYMGSDFGAVFDFKVCTKTADGKLVDLTADETTVVYKFGGDQVMDPAPTGYSDFMPGYYMIEISYKGYTAYANFTVNKSDNIHYVATVSKTGWKFGEEGATLSVNDATEFSAYYVTEADYLAGKDADDPESYLEDKRNNYSAEPSRLMTPGAYYLFAYCSETSTHNGAYTDYKRVVVQKGDLTIVNANSITTDPYSYLNGEKLGKIKLSDITISSDAGNDYENRARAVDAFGEEVYGEFVWQNPDTEIDSTRSGSRFPVKFVANEEYCPGYYNEKYGDAQAEITVYKGYVVKPYNTDSEWMYDGRPYGVSLGSVTYNYDKLVTATRNGTEMQIERSNDGCVLETVTEVATYTYTLSLKDKVNYYWIGHEDDPDTAEQTDTADWTYLHKILPLESYALFYKMPQLIPDNNGVVTVEIAPYLSPYAAGTLAASYDLGEITDPEYTATVAIEQKDGVDYLKISNIVRNAVGSSYTPGLPIRFTATGADHYADLDEYTSDIMLRFSMSRPDIPDLFIYKYTTAQILYDTFNALKTTVGDYTLKMNYGGSWMNINKNQYLPELNVAFEFKLVFEVPSSKIDPRVTVDDREISFTITGVEFDSPIAAGTKIEASAETTFEAIFANYELQNEYGRWQIDYQDEYGSWWNVGDNDLPEGETKCRLKFVNDNSDNIYVYGTPQNVEFTVVRTN